MSANLTPQKHDSRNLRPHYYSCTDIKKRMSVDLKAANLRVVKREISRPKILFESKLFEDIKSPDYFIKKARSRFLNTCSLLSLQKSHPPKQFDTKPRLRIKKLSKENSLCNQDFKYENPENLPNWLVQRDDFKEVVAMINQTHINIPDIFLESLAARTSEQKKALIDWVSSLKFFLKIPKKIIINVCDRLKREDFSAGSTLIRKGDRGDCIYLIFSGKANIYLELSIIHCEIGELEVVGEQALVNAKPRNATIIAATDMITFKLDKFDYDTILLNTKKQEKCENLIFLDTIEFFQKWSHLKIQNLAFHILQQSFTDQQVIFERDSPADTFYIIKSGCVEIQAYVSLIESNCWPTGEQEWKVLEINKECIVTIVRLNPGDFFGEPCLLKNVKRMTRAVSIKNTLLLSVNKEELYNIFNKKDIEELNKRSRYGIPNQDELRKKIKKEIEYKRNQVSDRQQQALLNSMNVDYKYAESRESLLDEKTRKLKSWILNLKKREKADKELFNKKVVSQKKKKLRISSVKNLKRYFESIKDSGLN